MEAIIFVICKLHTALPESSNRSSGVGVSMIPEFSLGTAARSLQLATFPAPAYRIELDRRAASKAATRRWVKKGFNLQALMNEVCGEREKEGVGELGILKVGQRNISAMSGPAYQ
jgi:hypothetical protein